MFLTAHVGWVLRCATEPQQCHQKTQILFTFKARCSGSVQAEQLIITNTTSVTGIVCFQPLNYHQGALISCWLIKQSENIKNESWEMQPSFPCSCPALLPEGRIIQLRLLQVLVLFLVFWCQNFLTIYSTDFIYIVACVNLLTSFWIRWCSLLELTPLVQTLNFCLFIWDSIANQFRHELANRTRLWSHWNYLFQHHLLCSPSQFGISKC